MNGMSAKTFVDTNVLIYAHDIDAGRKRDVAQNVLRELWRDRSGVLSMQVLQEFYVNAVRKIASPISKSQARAIISNYTPWCVEIGWGDLPAAFQIEDEAHVGFWDALIIASATKSGASRLLTEDLNAGQFVRGLRIENPFAEIR